MPEPETRPASFHYTLPQDRWTALHLASCAGYLDIAKLLVNWGATVDIRNGEKQTPLALTSHFSSRFGHLDVSRVLLDHGAK